MLDDRGEALAAELGDRARYRHLDVTSEAEWQTVVDEIRAREGRVDVLVNNAAVLHLATDRHDHGRGVRARAAR